VWPGSAGDDIRTHKQLIELRAGLIREHLALGGSDRLLKIMLDAR
jgi:hypothetical protein